jgi:hypothetical protein
MAHALGGALRAAGRKGRTSPRQDQLFMGGPAEKEECGWYVIFVKEVKKAPQSAANKDQHGSLPLPLEPAPQL